MIIYLIGFMGAGKTTVAKTLSSKMGLPFVDLDKAVEQQQKCSVSEIFASQGEECFRQLETQMLKTVSQTDDIIISVGGGTPCFHDNMDFMLENGVTVYLKLRPEILMSRLANAKTERPLLKNKTPEQLLKYITDTLCERERYYNKARVVIDNSSRNVDSLISVLTHYQNQKK